MEYFVVFFTSIGIASVNVAYFLCAIMICFPIYIFKRKAIYFKTTIHPSLASLLLFCLSYSLENLSLAYIRTYCITPILIFSSGWLIMSMGKQDYDQRFKKLISAIVVGFAMHAVANYSVNLASARNNIVDAFQGRILSATCAGGINTIIFSLVFCLIIEEKKYLKVCGFGCFIVSFIYSALLASRTQFIILILVFVITVVLYLHEQKNNVVALKFMFCMLSMCIIGYVIYTHNFFDIRRFIENSNVFIRVTTESLEYSDSVRISRFLEGISSLFQNPFGQKNAPYYHNMWLDVGKKAGIIPFISLLLYTVITTKHAVNIYCCKRLNIMTRYMILSVYLGLLFNLFVEPAMEGMLDIVLTSFLLNGAVEYYYYSSIKIIKSYKIGDNTEAENGKLKKFT